MLPGLREWVFSAKTFASAMIALYIALCMGLDRPYWAMMTVYIVAQPLTGAMRSKSVYRFAGTALGAVAAIALVPNLVTAPSLLTAALALWVGLCIYFALLDRTPRSYVFLLAGFTAAIIGFPCVDTPETIFATAISRASRKPRWRSPARRSSAPSCFPARSARRCWPASTTGSASARSLCLAVLAGQPDDEALGTARRSLAADAVEIRMLTSHLAFDTSNLQAATRPIEVLERRILLLLPVLSAIGDRLAALRAVGWHFPRRAGAHRPARRLDRRARCCAAGGGRAAPRRDPACRARHRRRVRLGCDPADRPADAAARPGRHRA